jgi:glucose-1-phosphate adenylyltransferase
MYRNMEVLALILHNGRGNHLHHLSDLHTQHEIRIAGKFRLIDFPISNCINSGIDHIAILDHSTSIPMDYSKSVRSPKIHLYPSPNTGWVKTWLSQPNDQDDSPDLGTADSIRQQIQQIKDTEADNVLVLFNDHLYRMDYNQLLIFHQKTKADITIAVHPSGIFSALHSGIITTNIYGRVQDYKDKPDNLKTLVDSTSRDDPEHPFHCPMGIFLCRTDILLELLNRQDYHDFKKQIIPEAVKNKRVYTYVFDGNLEDISSIRSYFNSNLKLTQANPPINLYDHNHPIYHEFSQLPGPKLIDCQAQNAILADGCWIKDALIHSSVIGERTQIGQGVVIKESLLMGMDDFPADPGQSNYTDNFLTVGRNSKIRGAIIGRNARLGENVIIEPFHTGTFINAPDWVVCDGIVVIKNDHYIKNGSYIGPLIKYQMGEKPGKRIGYNSDIVINRTYL